MRVNNASNIREKIMQRMNFLQIDQAELVKRTGLSSGHISDLIAGKRGKRPSGETVIALCKGLAVPVNFFYEDYSHKRVNRGSHV